MNNNLSSNVYKNFIIHIAFSKTGSTLLQENFKLIKNENFKFFTPSDEFTEILLEYLSKPNEIKKKYIHNIINNLKEKNIIISHERIIGHQSNGFIDVNTRFNLLENLFQNAHYIIFFREPSSIIYSAYFQGLQKKHNLNFHQYVHKDLNELYNTNVKNFAQCTNYKIYNYNSILRDYLNIKNRVLFLEYEDFFKSKNSSKLNEFIGVDVKINFSNKINISFKELKYLEFYNKFLIFKLIKIFLINYFKFLSKLSFNKKTFEIRSVSNVLVSIITFFNKFIPKKYYNEQIKYNEIILKKIEDYHSKNYDEFKKKLYDKI